MVSGKLKQLCIFFSLETLTLEVDREYKNLNKWYEKSDTFNTWFYFNEKVIDEENSESATTIPALKEKLRKNKVLYFFADLGTRSRYRYSRPASSPF